MALRAVRQDSDAATSESFTIPGGGGTYRLGSNATPAIPSGWQDVPLGASPVPIPPAPTLTTQLTSTRFGLTTTGVYKWWLASRTKYGQTVVSASPLTVTLTGSNNGAQLALPAATAAAYNPIVGRTLYRSTSGGSSPFWVADLDAVGTGSYTDTKADSELGDAAPVSDTSGISPSPVTVVGPGAVTWTERPSGTALSGLDYTVDYSSTPTGGLVTFAAADAGKVVTITYTAATLLTDAVLNAIITTISPGGTPACHAYGATNAASGFLVPLSMTSTRYDQGTGGTAQHDNVTNPSRLTCRVAGIYHISAQVFWQGSAAGTYRQVNLAVNGTNVSVIFVPPSAAGLGVQIATDWSLAVNDYVEVYVLHDAGSVLATGASTANEVMWHRVG